MEFTWQAGLKTNNFKPWAAAPAFTPSQSAVSNANDRLPRSDPTRCGPPQYFGSEASSRIQQDEAATLRPQQYQQYDGSNVYGRSRAKEKAQFKGPGNDVPALPINSVQKPGSLVQDLAQTRGRPHYDAGPQRRGRRGTVAGPEDLYGSSGLAYLNQNTLPVPQQYSWSQSITRYQENNTDLPIKISGASTTLGNPWRPSGNPITRLQGQTHAGNGIRKPKRTPMAKHRYQLGVIIRAPLHTEDFDQGSGKSYRGPDAGEEMQKHISQSALGDFVHSKIRKFIVVSLYDDHYIAVPLYTHNGEGLIRKKAAAYVSVQDHRQPPIKPQGNGVVITTQELEDHVDPYHPLSAAHTGRAVSREYGLPVVYEGRLDAASTDYVVQLWLDTMKGGTRKQ